MSAVESHGGDGAATGPSCMAQQPIRLALVVAITRGNGLGVNGTLPWSLPKEMAHFRRITSTIGSTGDAGDNSGQGTSLQNAVIMGRKTWQSIPPKFRPLKGRINVVVSRQSGDQAQQELGIADAKDAHLVDSLDAAVAILQSIPVQARLSRTFLIGGAQLYEQAMRLPTKGAVLDRLFITRIHEPAYAECDVFLPEFRTPSQIAAESGHGEDEPPPQPMGAEATHPPWLQAGQQDFESYLAGPIASDVVEEKGNKYSLQMWVRRDK